MKRAVYNGPNNNKERSKSKFIAAVGKIIKSKGFTGLTLSGIAKEAELDRKLITLYFGSLEELVETYIRGKDYFISAPDNAGSLIADIQQENIQQILQDILTHQFDYFLNDEEMQKIILWEISEKSKIMFEMAEEREKLGESVFKIGDELFDRSGIDIRGITGLIVGGIY